MQCKILGFVLKRQAKNHVSWKGFILHLGQWKGHNMMETKRVKTIHARGSNLMCENDFLKHSLRRIPENHLSKKPCCLRGSSCYDPL